jgi:hypothetical protein
MTDDDKLQDLYLSLTAYAAECIKGGHDVLAVSALMIRIGLELYKTTLNEEDYHRMVDFISESRNQINPIGVSNRVH